MPRASSSPPDYYATLQVHPRASADVIKAAYRALMKRHHPDADHATKGATAARVSEAYEVLSDPDKRSRYDRTRNDAGGKVIGGFRVKTPIAEGGCGKTYKGEHVLTGMPVCIKHCSNVSPEDEAIMIEEAQAMWDLRHYGIPAIHDLLRLDDGSLALVMSYIPGPTLAQLVEKNGRLDPEHVAWITERLLNILKYCHYQGIVHGDVKPQNVIVDPEKHLVTLVDFGLSAVKPKEHTASKGYTDVFAPPEQKKGKPLLPQIDFYSLGMTMIYALTADYDRVAARNVPDDTPDAVCEFVRRLVVRETLSRPDWNNEDLQETFAAARQKAFGRRRSNMKPLAY